MNNNQIIRNCLVIIYCYLTKVSSQINKCTIFEPNEFSLSIYSMVGLHCMESTCIVLYSVL